MKKKSTATMIFYFVFIIASQEIKTMLINSEKFVDIKNYIYYIGSFLNIIVCIICVSYVIYLDKKYEDN